MTYLKKNGFTLIEMMITVAILAVVFAIAAPSLVQFVNQTRLKSTAENMAQDMIMMRTEASRLNRKLKLDLRENCYGVTANSVDGCDCTITDSSEADFCEIKRDGGWRNIVLSPSSDFNGVIFDNIRGIPANLTDSQTVEITNSAGKITLNMTVIGGICLSSSGTTKIAGYKDDC